MNRINGYWGCLNNKGKENKKRFESYFKMARYANKIYGLNNWTYQWYPIKKGELK